MSVLESSPEWTMDAWKVKMTDLMVENDITCYLLEKYVDDSEVIVENVPVGTRWDNDSRKLLCTDEAVEEDNVEDKSREEITMRAWGEMASSLIPGVKFTIDYPANNTNGKVPMLDFMLWKESEDDPRNPGQMRECLKYCFL